MEEKIIIRNERADDFRKVEELDFVMEKDMKEEFIELKSHVSLFKKCEENF